MQRGSRGSPSSRKAPPSPPQRAPGFISRRRALLGLGGAALPLVGLRGGSARGAPYPTRLVVVFTPNGTVKSAWSPSGTETNFELSYILDPLAPFKDKLLILDGIDMESSYHGPGDASHWNGMGHGLTATELLDFGQGVCWGGGVSVDQFIAKSAGSATRLPSLELCVEAHFGQVSTRMAYLGPGQPVPPEASPWSAYERLFADVSPELLAKRKGVLALVNEDMSALSSRLGSEDRSKLEAHGDALSSIEARLEAGVLAAAACPKPELGAPMDAADASSFPAIGKLQMDILVTALACDITRVATLQWSYAGSETLMSWLGISETHHALSHKPPEDAAAQADLALINRWYAEQFMYLLAAMSAVPEGEGTLLDHSVVLWCNELSRGDTHDRRAMPYVLAGSAGGFFSTGRWLRYGGAAAGDVHGNLLVSLCNAMGVDVNSFGNPAYCTGPLRWLTG